MKSVEEIVNQIRADATEAQLQEFDRKYQGTGGNIEAQLAIWESILGIRYIINNGVWEKHPIGTI